MYSKNRQIGNNAEEVVCLKLKDQGFLIIERNYLRKWGEIDIIAKRGKHIYFFEVKSLQISAITGNNDFYQPEFNFSRTKRQKLRRTLQLYLVEKKIENVSWKFYLASVYMQKGTTISKISFIEEVL